MSTTEIAPVIFPLAGCRIYVAGHGGLVGSALRRRLARENCELITAARAELDLRRQADTESWLQRMQPDAIFVAAATVGGILENTKKPADFLYDNLMIETNVIEAARRAGVKKVLLIGSATVYPARTPQPIPEEALLSDTLEPPNESYAIAKITAIKLCAAFRRQHGCDFIAAQPNNLYGPHDTYDVQRSHVIPAMMVRMHQAKMTGANEVEIWGTGKPRREFLHVDDLADALVFLMERYSSDRHINVGSGSDITIADLAALIADVVGYKGKLHYLTDRPDGVSRRLLDCRRLTAMGWRPRIALRDGLADAYRWFLDNVASRSSEFAPADGAASKLAAGKRNF
jgi:GDP-L-fucose synthase